MSLLTLAMFSFSFQNKELVDDIASAFKSGSSTELSQYLNNTVELSYRWKNKKETLSKKKAILELKQFFKENPNQGFNVVHKGKSNDLSYVIGIYSSQEKNFRVYFLMKKIRSTYKITKIEFSVKP